MEGLSLCSPIYAPPPPSPLESPGIVPTSCDSSFCPVPTVYGGLGMGLCDPPGDSMDSFRTRAGHSDGTWTPSLGEGRGMSSMPSGPEPLGPSRPLPPPEGACLLGEAHRAATRRRLNLGPGPRSC